MAKIPSHIPSLPKPQDLYNIKRDNSNKPFNHALLPKNPETNHPVHPLKTLSLTPSDFLDHASTIENLNPTKPALLEDTPFKLVKKLEDLKELAMVLDRVDEFAVDLEHNQYRSFQGMTCLMQISTRTEDFIVDTLKLHASIGPYLREAFRDPKKRKVMHGACNDILWLQRDFGIYVCNLFDTMQASRVLGLERNSLAYLLKYYCEVYANKEYQMSDWRIRPLPKEMVKYAREDTHYLLYIYDLMRITLISRSDIRVLAYESNIRAFPYESDLIALDIKYKDKNHLLFKVYKTSFKVCLQLYKKQLFNEISWMDLEGIKEARLSVSQHGVASELYEWRDKMARADDESTSYVMSNKLLIEISKKMPQTISKLVEIIEKFEDHCYLKDHLDEIIEMIKASISRMEELFHPRR